jgi:hypothetical protein
MLTGHSMRRLLLVTLGVVLAASPVSGSVMRTPACPLVVQGLRRQGMAVQVAMRNQAPYAVGNVVIHVTFTDAARQTHQLAFHMNGTVAEHLTTVYTTPPITGTIVVWSTFAVTTECHMVRH